MMLLSEKDLKDSCKLYWFMRANSIARMLRISSKICKIFDAIISGDCKNHQTNACVRANPMLIIMSNKYLSRTLARSYTFA